MWTVIYMAQSKNSVEILKDLFENNNILVKVRPINREIDEDNCCYEMLVPDSEVPLAHELLIDVAL